MGHGAPPGNRNALKFGVYSAGFTRPMPQPPGMSVVEALELEIHRIRLYIRENLASASLGSLDVGTYLALLRAVTIAVGRIQHLQRRIHALQISHAFESGLCRSLAGELAFFPALAQESGLPAPLFSRSPPPRREAYHPQKGPFRVRGGAGEG